MMVWTLSMLNPTLAAMAFTVTLRSWVMSLTMRCGVSDHASLVNDTLPSMKCLSCLDPCKGHVMFSVHLWHSSMNVRSHYSSCCQKMSNASLLFFRYLHFTVSLLTSQMTALDDWHMLLLAFSHVTCTCDPLVAGILLPCSCRNHSLLHMQWYCPDWLISFLNASGSFLFECPLYFACYSRFLGFLLRRHWHMKVDMTYTLTYVICQLYSIYLRNSIVLRKFEYAESQEPRDESLATCLMV